MLPTLKNGGYYAIGSMRTEKGYRAWGHELSPDTNPVEAGLMFAVDLNKPGGFLGKEAVLRAKDRLQGGGGGSSGSNGQAAVVPERLVSFEADLRAAVADDEYGGAPCASLAGRDGATMLWGGESILLGGELVGHVTSTALEFV